MEHWATEYFQIKEAAIKEAAVSGLIPKILFTGNMLANAFHPKMMENLPSTDIADGMIRRRAIPTGPGTVPNSAVQYAFKMPSVSSLSPHAFTR